MVDRPKVSEPPKGYGTYAKPCEHQYEFLYSDYEKIEGPGLNHYKQTNTFYCAKCLEHATKIARTADERYKPEWYKGK